MQQQLLQCGSRLCHLRVLELHNASVWVRKWHIPYPDSPVNHAQHQVKTASQHGFVNLIINLRMKKNEENYCCTVFLYINKNIIISTLDNIMSEQEGQLCQREICQMRLNMSVCFVFACVVLHAERRPTGRWLEGKKGQKGFQVSPFVLFRWQTGCLDKALTFLLSCLAWSPTRKSKTDHAL